MGESISGVFESGIYRYGNVRISDLSGEKRLPIGNDNFVTCVENSVFVDKSMFIADILDSGTAAMLYCRPRRFGKSLNLSMLQRFFEIPSPSEPMAMDTTPLFRGLAIWDAKEGAYRAHHQAYPVIRFSLNSAKGRRWDESCALIKQIIIAEYRRHYYLLESDRLKDADRRYARDIIDGHCDDRELGRSLVNLSSMLSVHHGHRVVILVDEYDAPIMAGYTHGYYNDVVTFLKSWLTAALKGNDTLAFAVLAGVQRISKESIFSDLNNLLVDTSLSIYSDERYGFTQQEVDALASYLGVSYSREEMKRWYDGFRFGKVDVYNPWSALNYFAGGCEVDVYWGNTSSNEVIGELVSRADERTLDKIYHLLSFEGTVDEPLDLRVVFPDVGIGRGDIWSLLYLAGYLTTDDTAVPNDTERIRSLRIPNWEIAKLYRAEVIDRFASLAGSRSDSLALQRAFVQGDVEQARRGLEHVLLDSASAFDLVRENSYHMLLVGLLFGTPGYKNPTSNREAGRGRYDICLAPEDGNTNPAVLIELKHSQCEVDLELLAAKALDQIEKRAYAAGCDIGTAGVLRYGLAFHGKHLAIAFER